RASIGVRGIRLGADPALGKDEVISMTVLRHVNVSPAESRAYLRQAIAMRRALNGDDAVETEVLPPEDDEEVVEDVVMSPERYAELGALEQFVLTVSENGYGKRSSAYEYRVSGRGGKGIIAMAVTR